MESSLTGFASILSIFISRTVTVEFSLNTFVSGSISIVRAVTLTTEETGVSLRVVNTVIYHVDIETFLFLVHWGVLRILVILEALGATDVKLSLTGEKLQKRFLTIMVLGEFLTDICLLHSKSQVSIGTLLTSCRVILGHNLAFLNLTI